MTAYDPACLPPDDLPGLDRAWSRLVTGTSGDGEKRTWHVLDTHADGDEPAALTLLCVHGNPTWSYTWRSLLAAAPDDVRVVAADQLDMGFSERTGVDRTLAMRIDDLDGVVDALDLRGPIVAVAHDWGGPIALGWSLRHRDVLAGVVLLNTAVHQPREALPPAVIRGVRSRPLLWTSTVGTKGFITGTTLLSRPTMSRAVARAYAAPYATAERRLAIGQFVADIPLEDDHPSRATLDGIADQVGELDVPALFLWGPGDPVFSDRYLRDLAARMPQADIHRYEGARHLVIEDAPTIADDLLSWVDDLRDGPGNGAAAEALAGAGEPLWQRLSERARTAPDGPALVEPAADGWRTIRWGRLSANVERIARGLHARGVRPGDRVAVLITPGADLLAVVYACWRLGAVVVVTDAGLGARGIVRALRGSGPRFAVAIPRAERLLRFGRVGGTVIPSRDLVAIADEGDIAPPLPSAPGADDDAVIAFTSGSTGPAKGVAYTHAQVQRTRDLLARHYGLGEEDGLVAAFAPWALLGPALGIPSVLPRMDLSVPDSLTASALADAVTAGHGTVLWASPAALANVLRTQDSLDASGRRSLEQLRLVLGAGAPVSSATLHGIRRLCPKASIRTPYGMTEVLPVAEATIDDIDAAGPGEGVLVGRPLPGVSVMISAVDREGRAVGVPATDADVLGEVLVAAPHGKSRYDRLWATERASSRDAGWHRTGDLGHLDTQGWLWIEGRLAHVITTPEGPVGPVGIEQSAQRVPGVEQAAAVGVGPVGTQQVVVVVVSPGSRRGVADPALSEQVREAVGVPVAAVLVRDDLPVDIRHRAKIDRTAVGRWAAGILEGRRRP